MILHIQTNKESVFIEVNWLKIDVNEDATLHYVLSGNGANVTTSDYHTASIYDNGVELWGVSK